MIKWKIQDHENSRIPQHLPKSRTRRRAKADYYDYSLVAVIVLLTCFGLIMLYSTSSYTAQINYGSDMYFFKKQTIISIACIIMALIISKINYRILNRFSYSLVCGSTGVDGIG